METSQIVPFSFGPTELFKHTPLWAKKIVITAMGLIPIYNTLIGAYPLMMPHHAVIAINSALGGIALVASMFGLKLPFMSTPDNKDVPASATTVIKTDSLEK